MKNGRAMRGHRRHVAPIGERVGTRTPPTGGWRARCLCSWDGGAHPTTAAARRAYRAHLDEAIDVVPRLCRRCGETKPGSEMADRWSRHICKACYSALGNEWSRQNPEAAARHKRRHHVLFKFGITLEEAEQMLTDQGGRCAVCAREITDPRGHAPHVDHDHDTGQVRGILCFTCNVGLGAFGDDPERLRAAATYLERSA